VDLPVKSATDMVVQRDQEVDLTDEEVRSRKASKGGKEESRALW